MLRLFFKRVQRTKKKVVKKRNTSYVMHKEAARSLIHERLEYFNTYYALPYNRVAIRDQRRCWGSCSSKGNLNFSYKLLFLPPCLRDYVIVHELSHLRVMNHSADFWAVVSERLPDCLKRAATLRTLERTKGTALKTLQTLAHDCAACEFCQADREAETVQPETSSNEIFRDLARTTSDFTTN